MNKSRQKLFVVLAIVFLLASVLQAKRLIPGDLDAYVARALKTFEVLGITVAIVKDGKVVVAKGYGVKKLGEAVPVDENTLFAIGSNSKVLNSSNQRRTCLM